MEPQSIKIHMVKIKYCGAHSCVSKMEGISQEHLIVCSGNEFIVLKWCLWWHVWSVQRKFCTCFGLSFLES